MSVDQEGVIKYTLNYRWSTAPERYIVQPLITWRNILYEKKLTGQDPLRYGGLGFGNISCRHPKLGTVEQPAFVISGTQTGHLPLLNESHFSSVTECNAQKNILTAEGPIAPSSEAMTHDTVYKFDSSINYVMHVHSPLIWNKAKELMLPTTAYDIAYGTPEMTQEVERLFRSGRFNQTKLFVMGGHIDGIVSFGKTIEQAGNALLEALKSASL